MAFNSDDFLPLSAQANSDAPRIWYNCGQYRNSYCLVPLLVNSD